MKSWGWHNECIWVFVINAVGNYFSQVTGWTPMSVYASLGVFCEFLPNKEDIKKDKSELLLPKYEQCHFKNHLSCWLDQGNRTALLQNPAERKRKDIWWIEPDGSNLGEAIADIKKSFLLEGVSWLKNMSNKESILKEIDAREKLLYEIENHFAKGYGK